MKPATEPANDTTIIVAEATSSGPQRPLLFQILIWVICASLLACGTATFILFCISPSGLSRAFISFYLMTFGIIACMSQLRIAAFRELFGLLNTDYGLGLFFCFCGTLGMSFGFRLNAATLVPFFSGIFWIASGAILITGGAILKCRTTNTAA